MLKIAIVDSGAGGLSILTELLQRQLNCNTVYLADLEMHPYGIRGDDILIHRVHQIIKTLIEHEAPDLCVIACNTASTIVLPSLRERWSLPFIGVVPAIKPAAQLSHNQCIGVLATPATVEREYLNQLIENFARDVTVFRYGSERLVTLAEQYVQTGKCDSEKICEELCKLIKQSAEIDTVVLACTHFPLIIDACRAYSDSFNGIRFIDSSSAIINRMEDLMPSLKSMQKPSHKICRVLNTSDFELRAYAKFLSENASNQRGCSSTNFEFAHLAIEN